MVLRRVAGLLGRIAGLLGRVALMRRLARVASLRLVALRRVALERLPPNALPANSDLPSYLGPGTYKIIKVPGLNPRQYLMLFLIKNHEPSLYQI